MQGKKLHERFMEELELVYVQLDELWANVKNGGQDMWLWVATDVKTKLIPVMQVGGRNQAIYTKKRSSEAFFRYPPPIKGGTKYDDRQLIIGTGCYHHIQYLGSLRLAELRIGYRSTEGIGKNG